MALQRVVLRPPRLTPSTLVATSTVRRFANMKINTAWWCVRSHSTTATFTGHGASPKEAQVVASRFLGWALFDRVTRRRAQFSATARHASSEINDDDSKQHGGTGLHVYNSLTRAIVPFEPMTPGQVTWYQCGPTVYDDAHIGHACTYVRFDVLRRVLQQHFGHCVTQFSGMTDIDDKIIAKAKATQQTPTAVAKAYEQDFYRDMASLNVLPPTGILRVTEHISDIVAFIETIMERGHAYSVDDGSVYFDTEAFGPTYGKLAPARQSSDDDADQPTPDSVKKGARDFALWKSVPADSMGWTSPWGHGRPGWHIECSAMAGSVFGPRFDLHTGGIDLLFPHHDNEIAQSESCYACDEWATYFFHSGHLQIAGTKMSKSLQNTISIAAFLGDDVERNSNVIRLVCLLHHYRRGIRWSDGVVALASGSLDKLQRLFLLCADTMDATACMSNSKSWGSDELALLNKTTEAQRRFHEALCNDFDTPAATKVMLDLAGDATAYINSTPVPVTEAVAHVASVVQGSMSMFGLRLAPDLSMAGWSAATVLSRQPPASNHQVEHLTQAVEHLTAFRDQIRVTARSLLKRDPNTAMQLFHYCDVVREELAGLEKPLDLRDGKSG